MMNKEDSLGRLFEKRSHCSPSITNTGVYLATGARRHTTYLPTVYNVHYIAHASMLLTLFGGVRHDPTRLDGLDVQDGDLLLPVRVVAVLALLLLSLLAAFPTVVVLATGEEGTLGEGRARQWRR